MKYLFYLGHPAHFHLFFPIIKTLQANQHEIKILIKKKDILEDLLVKSKLDYINILPKGRRNGLLSIIIAQLKRDYQLFKCVNTAKPSLMIGTSAEIAHIGRIKSIPSIVVNEDDYKVVPLFTYFSYPFATHILAPTTCLTGQWQSKSIVYQGYHELSYLHPNQFKPDLKKIMHLFNGKKKYFLLRFSNLNAHHDQGKIGIKDELADIVIKKLATQGEVYISSERNLPPEFEKYRINIDPLHIHHALYYAAMYIGDSQTMAAEAAVLGTPSLRFNDFVGKLSYLEELEHKYRLTYGIRTSEPDKLLKKIDELITTPDLKEEWQRRRIKMLADKIDVAAFIVWFMENFPESVGIVKENPEYQYQFK